MFGRQDESLSLFLGSLQFVELLLGLGQAGFQLLDLAARRFLSAFLHLFHDCEGAVQGRAATHGDQIAVTCQLLDHALREVQIAVLRDDDLLSENVLHLDADRIKDQVAVAHQDDHAVRTRFFQGIVRLGLGFLLVAVLLFALVFLLAGLFSGFPVRERGLEFARQPDRQSVFLVRGLEILFTAAELGHDFFDQL